MAAKGKKKKETAGFAGELEEPRWSIVSFEKRVAKNLTYAAAAERLARLDAKKVAGLCIVSDEAAERINAEARTK